MPDKRVRNFLQVDSLVVSENRYILDGWPLTKDQVDLLNKHRMIPVCIVELQVSDEECLRRGECDRKSPSRYVCVFVCVCVHACAQMSVIMSSYDAQV